MSDDFGFAPPPFKAADALVALKRQLRDLKLTERGNNYERSGKRIVELTLDEPVIRAKLVKKPALTPEWTSHALANAADVRRFTDTVKSQLARWSDAD